MAKPQLYVGSLVLHEDTLYRIVGRSVDHPLVQRAATDEFGEPLTDESGGALSTGYAERDTAQGTGAVSYDLEPVAGRLVRTIPGQPNFDVTPLEAPEARGDLEGRVHYETAPAGERVYDVPEEALEPFHARDTVPHAEALARARKGIAAGHAELVAAAESVAIARE